ncbi:HAD hydrolase-like protein [Paenibacillus dendritiformis]|uniref:HAD hydrolase-like protein n=1 Tax=Paenibacillus dendritiformis TaxID=130049 RepID=UPI0020BFD366|nr:HAD hydrolase-like protein [Paenibacillus dendritiformis]
MPHSSEAGCDCRKPSIGLLLRAAAEHGLDLARCAVIGDVGDTDIDDGPSSRGA